MSEYTEYALGPDAIDYLKGHLSRGLTLSHLFLDKQDIGEGRITTGLPSQTNLDRLSRLEEGGILPPLPDESKTGKTPMFYDYVSGAVLYELVRDNDALFVLENRVASFPDVGPNLPGVVHWACDEEIYDVVTTRYLSGENIERAVRDAHSLWTLVGFVTSLPGAGSRSNDRREISVADLEIMASNVRKVIVTAYDAEGFLIWHKA
jgi:hypothetical protein